MKNIRTIIGIGAIVVLIGGAIVIATKNTANDSSTPRAATGPVLHDPSTLKPGSGIATAETDADTAYTMAQVSGHNSASSCWTVIRGGVFDLTTWINRHPGGRQAILGICGIDGTAAFDAQHEGQGRPEQTLASFKIGILK